MTQQNKNKNYVINYTTMIFGRIMVKKLGSSKCPYIRYIIKYIYACEHAKLYSIILGTVYNNVYRAAVF